MNGSSDIYWPEILTAAHLGGSKCIEGLEGGDGGPCVSSGLPLLLTVFSYNVGANGFEISTPEELYPRLLQWTPKAEGLSAEAWSFAPHVATSLFSTQLWQDPHWYPREKKFSGENLAKTVAKAAAVRTVCSPNIQTFDEKTLLVSIPLLEPYRTWIDGNATTGDFIDVHLKKPLWGNSSRSLTTNKHPTTVFISPDPSVGSVTTGLVLMGPVRPSGDRVSMVCSVDARWNRAVHSIKQSRYYGLGNPGNPVTATISGRHSDHYIIDGVLPMKSGDWTSINADPEWLEGALGYKVLFHSYVDPVSANIRSAREQAQTSALGAFLMIVGIDVNKTSTSVADWDSGFVHQMEPVISTAFADAISRTGYAQQAATIDFLTDFAEECMPIPGSVHRGYQFCPGPNGDVMNNFTEMMLSGSTNGEHLFHCNESLSNIPDRESLRSNRVRIQSRSTY